MPEDVSESVAERHERTLPKRVVAKAPSEKVAFVRCLAPSRGRVGGVVVALGLTMSVRRWRGGDGGSRPRRAGLGAADAKRPEESSSKHASKSRPEAWVVSSQTSGPDGMRRAEPSAGLLRRNAPK